MRSDETAAPTNARPQLSPFVHPAAANSDQQRIMVAADHD